MAHPLLDAGDHQRYHVHGCLQLGFYDRDDRSQQVPVVGTTVVARKAHGGWLIAYAQCAIAWDYRHREYETDLDRIAALRVVGVLGSLAEYEFGYQLDRDG